MKLSPFAGALAAALILSGCEQPVTDKDKEFDAKALTVTAGASYVYYDLDTGTEVSDATSSDWDIAFAGVSEGIRTNSGASAAVAGSDGSGGSSYSGKTVFNDVKSYNAAGIGEDTSYWVTTVAQTTTTAQKILNVITKLDYSGGDGLAEETAYTNDASAGVYDGSAYYAYDFAASPPALVPSQEVYIIRHGDGTHYSKLQITAMSGTSGARERVIKYANF